MPINVLLVDDSAVIRGLMSKALSVNPNIIIAGSAYNGSQAITLANQLKPDVIVLDIEMPVMDGITALPELVRVSPNSKIIMSSALTERNAAVSLQALSLGAADYLTKPTSQNGSGSDDFHRELTNKILALGMSNTTLRPALLPTDPSLQPAKPVKKMYPQLAAGETLNPAGVKALAIASSTGGPQALSELLAKLKGTLKNVPIFITQHMPATFTMILAEQLSKTSERPCHEAKNGEIALAGHVYIAPGNFHMVMSKNTQNEIAISLNQEAQENFCRPSADPMLRSLSAIYGKHLAVVVLTGMGQDGLEGAKEVVKNGGSVIAQDEATCVVYGMPRAVVENNLCKTVLPLAEIAPLLVRQIDRG